MSDNQSVEKYGKFRDKKGRFTDRHPGFKKGVKEEISKAKLDIFEVYSRLGGVDGLHEWVNENKYNKREFFKSILQLLPKETRLEGEGIQTIVKNIVHYREPKDTKGQVNNPPPRNEKLEVNETKDFLDLNSK